MSPPSGRDTTSDTTVRTRAVPVALGTTGIVLIVVCGILGLPADPVTETWVFYSGPDRWNRRVVVLCGLTGVGVVFALLAWVLGLRRPSRPPRSWTTDLGRWAVGTAASVMVVLWWAVLFIRPAAGAPVTGPALLLQLAVPFGLAAGLLWPLRALGPLPSAVPRRRWSPPVLGTVGAAVAVGWLAMTFVVVVTALSESAPAALGLGATGLFALTGSLELLIRTAVPASGPRVRSLTVVLAGLLGGGSLLFGGLLASGWFGGEGTPEVAVLSIGLIVGFPVLAGILVGSTVRTEAADWPAR